MSLAPRPTLTETDYIAAAKDLGVEVAAIKAVAEVESKANPFDSSGRPTILYERHYFRTLTQGRFDHDYPDLSGDPRSKGQYGSRAMQYERLAQAWELDPWAALQSVSWGRFQVMGRNYATLGYSSPEEMALAMSRSEKAHLDAFVGYVKGTPACLQGLRAKNWTQFAVGYNGKDQANFEYDKKIEAAYVRLSNVKVSIPSTAIDAPQVHVP